MVMGESHGGKSGESGGCGRNSVTMRTSCADAWSRKSRGHVIRTNLSLKFLRTIFLSLFIGNRLHYCIVTRWSIKRCLSHGMCLYQVMMTLHFLNDVDNDAESTQSSIITA